MPVGPMAVTPALGIVGIGNGSIIGVSAKNHRDGRLYLFHSQQSTVMKTREELGITLFAIALVLLQFAGYAFVPLLAGALLLLFSQHTFATCVKSVPLF
ncbi:hypothetical protein, partial [Cellulomonas carbonis]|uniref:hypothetical protein n=1 Tax=Cellulomonas carbonis TaxID=1386092 RepID=UPI0013789C49